MKKTSTAWFIVILSFFILTAGCVDNKDSTTPSTEGNSPIVTVTTPAVIDTTKLSEYTNYDKDAPDSLWYINGDCSVFMSVHQSIKNASVTGTCNDEDWAIIRNDFTVYLRYIYPTFTSTPNAQGTTSVATVKATARQSTTSTNGNSGNIANSYWKGDFPVTIYPMEDETTRTGKITGIPYMITKYNRVSGEIVDVKFGMYNTEETGSQVHTPPVDADPEEAEIVGIGTPVITFVGWNLPPEWGSQRNKEIINGVNSFSFNLPTAGGFRGYTAWSFTYTSSFMTGTIENHEPVFGGFESDVRAIKLSKID